MNSQRLRCWNVDKFVSQINIILQEENSIRLQLASLVSAKTDPGERGP